MPDPSIGDFFSLPPDDSFYFCRLSYHDPRQAQTWLDQDPNTSTLVPVDGVLFDETLWIDYPAELCIPRFLRHAH